MPPRKKKPAAGSIGLAAAQTVEKEPSGEVRALVDQIRADGGAVIGAYREPYGGHWVIAASLPIDKIEPTPYQRELSETHADRLAAVMGKVGRFLDPLIAVRHDGGYWTPNGMHRLIAMRRLGAKAIVALVVPEHEVAFRILALNTEKAHNLKDKSLEVVRMARALASDPATQRRPEADWAFEFEEAAYLPIGVCYERKPRFSGGAYLPVVKRTIEFADRPIAKALEAREAQAERLLELDDAVNQVVERIKAAGFKSAYLKPFVVARVNPLRFVRAAKPGQKAPRAEFDGTMDKMIASARKFDVGKVRAQDLATGAVFAGMEASPE